MQRIDKLRLTIAGISLGFPARDPPRPRPRPRQRTAKKSASPEKTMQEIIPSHYFPTAPTFDGIHDKLDLPYSRELNPASFTVEMWVMPQGGSGYQSILASVGGSAVEGRRGYLFCVNPGRQWQFWLGTGEPKAFWRVLTGPLITLNVWTHLTGTYNQQSGIVTFHVNGYEVGRQVDVPYLPNDRNPTRVGAGATEQLGASPCFFRGKVAEVHVWDRVLSSREILGLATQEAIEVQAESIAEIATDSDNTEPDDDFDPTALLQEAEDNSTLPEEEQFEPAALLPEAEDNSALPEAEEQFDPAALLSEEGTRDNSALPGENEKPTDYNPEIVDPWEEPWASGSGETGAIAAETPLTKKPDDSVGSILWQIGSPGKAGAAMPTGPWTMVYDYTIGTDPYQIDRPTIPACLVPLNANKIPNSTSLLNIHFFLACDYPAEQLVLCYDRYGSEEDNIFLDGQLIATTPGAEGGKLKQSQIPLGDAPQGFHTISLANANSSDGAHLIDYIQLKSMLSNINSQLANLAGGNLPQQPQKPGFLGWETPGMTGLGNTPANPTGQPTNPTENPTDLLGQLLNNLPCPVGGDLSQGPAKLLEEAGETISSLLSNVTAQLTSLLGAIQPQNNPAFAGVSAMSGSTLPGGQTPGTPIDPTVLLGSAPGLGGLGNVVGGLGDTAKGVAGAATGGGGNPADLLGNATETVGNVAGGVTGAVGGVAGMAGALTSVESILTQGTQLIGQVQGLMGQVNTFMGQLTNLIQILVPLIQETQNMVKSTLPALPFSPFGSNQTAATQQTAQTAQMLEQINQMSQMLNQLTQMLNQQAQVAGMLPGQVPGQVSGMAGNLNPTQLAQLQQLQAAQRQLQGLTGQATGMASGLNPTQLAQLQAAQQQLRGMGAQTGMSPLPPELLAQLQQQQR